MNKVMNSDTPISISAPYLVYFGDVQEESFAKTGLGLAQWRREDCVGQMSRPGCEIRSALPDLTIEQAVAEGAKSIVIGVASVGGAIPSHWVDDLASAARHGLDIVSGMHSRLTSIPVLVEATSTSGARLLDIRTPTPDLPIATGDKRSGKRLLTVGTDCAVGKKYTALAIEKEMQARRWNVDFRATGQTGIMIAGSGIPIDAVVSDFIAGAAEILSPAADEGHWDVIEGQGSLSHPSFAGVSLGLLHGSQPDALVLCHDAARSSVSGLGLDRFPILPFSETIECALAHAHRVNSNARFVGLSVNTSRIESTKRLDLLDQYAEETGLPVIDPIIDGTGPIVDRIASEFS